MNQNKWILILRAIYSFQTCKLLEPLIIYDPTELHGSEYLICLNGEAKYGYLQTEEDANLALVLKIIHLVYITLSI